MKKFKLSSKIIGGFGIVILLMIGVIGVYQFSSIRTTDGFENLLSGDITLEMKANHAEVLMERALRAKSNFMLTSDLKYMDEHTKSVDALIENLTAIQTMEQDEDPAQAKVAAEMITLAGEYRGHIDNLVKAYQAIGLAADQGLQGAFRDAAHAMQKAMPEHEQEDLLVALLMMRRYEKDYMLAPEVYHDKYQAAVKYYGAFIKDHENDMNPQVKTILQENFTKYQAAADKLLADPTQEIEANAQVLKDACHASEAAIKTVNVPGVMAMVYDIRKNEKDYMLRFDDKYITATNDKVAKLKETLNTSGIAQEHIDEFIGHLDTYQKAFNGMVDQYKALATTKGEMQGVVDRLLPMIEGIATESKTAGDAITEQIIGQAKSLAGIAIAASLITIGLALVLAFALARSICRPIDNAVKNMMAGAEQVSAAAGQVSASSQSLAEGATEQAASLEETSASMEEMSSMTRQNADNASQADSLMRESLATIQQADDSMTEMDSSMNDIAEASAATSKIIKTIDEIAFQTNLLALNAAVEAARAGEAGAGFAVVAEEVRNLAMRSTEAAKNTAALIEGTVSKVTRGKEIVSKATEAFHGVAESSAKVASLIGEIATASREQSQGFGQINQAITQMDTVTQQNSATAEESAAAATELSSQSASMMEVVKEMQSLVNGAATTKKAAAPPAKTEKIIAVPTKSRQTALPAPALRRPPVAAKAAAAPPKSPRPEDVIPMDNDDSFEDF
ncbi:MAG: methyl-accepting chemotaxis protein [Desulfobulbaceae bacterium]|nr:methyl-accepting chemotaxis protein [Desulfobulbaceae bacterium]